MINQTSSSTAKTTGPQGLAGVPWASDGTSVSNGAQEGTPGRPEGSTQAQKRRGSGTPGKPGKAIVEAHQAQGSPALPSAPSAPRDPIAQLVALMPSIGSLSTANAWHVVSHMAGTAQKRPAGQATITDLAYKKKCLDGLVALTDKVLDEKLEIMTKIYRPDAEDLLQLQVESISVAEPRESAEEPAREELLKKSTQTKEK